MMLYHVWRNLSKMRLQQLEQRLYPGLRILTRQSVASKEKLLQFVMLLKDLRPLKQVSIPAFGWTVSDFGLQPALLSQSTTKTLKETLKPDLSAHDIFEKIKRESLRDSGLWIIKEPTFKSWSQHKTPLLWIYGPPGVGKTFISCSIIEYLQQLYSYRFQETSQVCIAYFFCRRDMEDLRSFSTLLRTVAHQIASQDAVYATYIQNLANFSSEQSSITGLWKDLFVNFFIEGDPRSRALIILDGLDEANENELEEFLGLLVDLESFEPENSVSKLQILLMSRPEVAEQLEDGLGILPTRLEISSTKNGQDIERYICERVKRSPKLRRRPESIQNEIITKLSSNANGLFLWAKLMLKEIQTEDRIDGIRRTLNNLPRDLTSTLQQITRRLTQTLKPHQLDDLKV